MTAIVYIDGFNFYYRCAREWNLRWVDLAKLARRVVPSAWRIAEIKYFTALVKPLPHNPDAPARQQVYLRALKTIPNLSIHYGAFLTHEKVLPLANPEPGGPRTCRVLKTEEKGSDVNLATHLLLDAFRKRCDAAFVISIDSDLVEPIRVVRSAEFGVRVGLGRPRNRTSWMLTKNVDFVRKINPGMMRRSLFPDRLSDAHGTFFKPSSW